MAIIALLVSVLVPTLQDATQLAKMSVCASNMHQIGVGLAIYLSQWDNEYFPPWLHPTIFFENSYLAPFDNRQNLYDIAGGATMVYYCPLSNPIYWPSNSEVKAVPGDYWTEWADRFHVQGPVGVGVASDDR